MFKLLKLEDYKPDETIRTLEVLLKQARRGQISAFVYAAEYAERRAPVAGYTGRCMRDTYLAVGLSSFMLREFHLIAEERHRE